MGEREFGKPNVAAASSPHLSGKAGNSLNFVTHRAKRVFSSEQHESFGFWIDKAKDVPQHIVGKVSILNHWTREDVAGNVAEQIFVQPLVKMLQ